MKRTLGFLINVNKIFYLLIFLIVLFGCINKTFFTIINFQNLLLQSSFDGILVIGMVFVLIGRNFDLSIGSTLALSTVLAVRMLNSGMNIISSIIVTTLVGCLIGVINGFMISVMNVNSFIATLGMMISIRGLAYLFSGERPIYSENMEFSKISNEIKLLGIPLPFIIFFILLVISFVILKYTIYGRNLYAIGSGKEDSCALMGINIKLNKIVSFAICGITASLTGVLMASRLNQGSPLLGQKSLFIVFAAAILGGVSLYGGEGNTIGAFFGLLVLVIISNGLNLLETPSYYQTVIKGLILIIAIFLDMYLVRRRKF